MCLILIVAMVIWNGWNLKKHADIEVKGHICAYTQNAPNNEYLGIESRDYAPLLCMLGLDKSGEGAYTRDSYISIWWPLPTVECHVGARKTTK